MKAYTSRKPYLLSGMVSGLCLLCQFVSIFFIAAAPRVLAADQQKNERIPCKLVQGLHLEQKSTIINDLDIDTTSDYVRVSNKRAGTVTVARAPDWLVTTYNSTRKIYYSVRPEQFSGKFAMFSGSLSRNNLQAFPMVAGPVHEYRAGDKTFKTTTMLVANTATGRLCQTEEQVWNPRIYVFADKAVSKVAANLVCRLYDLPPLGLLPLGCDLEVPSSSAHGLHKVKIIVQTKALNKGPVSVPLSDYPDLSKFKKLPDESAFSNANNGNLEIKDFTDYIGH